MMKIFDLPPQNGRKSFYGKAKIIEQDGEKILLSYDTLVAKITTDNKIKRLWDGTSSTTSTHFKSFLIFYGLPVAQFNKLKVEE